MSIVKIVAPLSTGPSVFASPVVEQLLNLVLNIDAQNRFKHGFVLKGASFNIGGVLFVANADTAISGTDTGLVKFTVSGNEATCAYVAPTSVITWHGEYNGYYDGSGNYHAFVDYCAVRPSVLPYDPRDKTLHATTVSRVALPIGEWSTISTLTLSNRSTSKSMFGFRFSSQDDFVNVTHGDTERLITSKGVILDSWASAYSVTRDVTCDITQVDASDIVIYHQFYENSDNYNWLHGPFADDYKFRDAPATTTEIPAKTLLLHAGFNATLAVNF